MRLKITFLILIGMIGFQSVSAQKFDDRRLNLYIPGAKVLPYKVGDMFTFKMKDFDHYYNFQITDLRNDSILFDNRVVRLHQIESVKYPRSSENFARNAANSLYIFGGSWPIYTGVDNAFGNNPNWISAGIVAATSGVLGFIISRFARPKTYVLDEDYYLKILIP